MLLGDLKWEFYSVTFSGETDKSITFNTDHKSIPVVTAKAEGDVNTYIQRLTISGCQISTSAPFTGEVIVHVLGT